MLKKINTEGFKEQFNPYKCPECDFDFLAHPENCEIGYGEYPIGGYRNTMKPNQTLCMAMECPNCFLKSVCHTSDDIIKGVGFRLEIINESKDAQQLKEAEDG